MKCDHKDRIGLALGGGGSKGAYQLGAWQAFREEGLRFSAIAGTSIGSVNGAFMAIDDYDGACEMWETCAWTSAWRSRKTVRSSRPT
jgi:NTE family protein